MPFIGGLAGAPARYLGRIFAGRASRRKWLILAAIVVLVAAGAAALLAASGWKREYARRGTAEREAIVASQAPPPVKAAKYVPLDAADARKFNASVPLAVERPVAARPFAFAGDEAALARALDCLAAAAIYEAGDDADGQRAVVQTVINRSRHPAFPASICAVVFQGSERRTGCQFTFTCDGALRRVPSPAAFERARRVAREALYGKVDERVGNATHYHADYVVPYWSASLDKIAVVGAHIFYRWPGYWGTPAAFRRAHGGTEPVVPRLAFLSAAHAADAGDPSVEVQVPSALSGPEPVAVPTPLPPPPVSEQALRGNVVQQVSRAEDTYFLRLDAQAFAGSYAMTALALCKDKRACRVLGWREHDKISEQVPLPEEAARTLSFAYVKDLRRGIEVARWNCQQIAGRTPGQCLPGTPSEIAALLQLD